MQKTDPGQDRRVVIVILAKADAWIDQDPLSLDPDLTDGTRLIALRFAFDYGRYRLDDPSRLGQSGMNYLSLWYAVGDRFVHSDGGWRMDGEAAGDSLLVASEPLTQNVAGWVEVPEYTAIVAALDGDGLHIDTVAMDI